MNINCWKSDEILKKIQNLFIGEKNIDEYNVVKKYLQKDNSKIQIFFTCLKKTNL